MSCRPLRYVCAACTCATLIAAPLAACSPAAADGPQWIPPVPGRVVHPFLEPVATYAAGHRGVDFAATPGSSVKAANSGVVSFAGNVAGSLHVVVAHDGGIRTSYSFLLRVDVQVGQRVQRGQAVGAAGGSGDGHAAGVLHFGVRVGERYVDPMLLFAPRDLTELVRLVPTDEQGGLARPDPAGDGAALQVWLGEGGSDDDSCGGLVGDVAGAVGIGEAASSICDAVRDAANVGLDLLRTGGDVAARLADRMEPWVHAVIDRMEATGDGLVAAAQWLASTTAGLTEAAAETLAAAVQAVVDLGIAAYERLTSCPQPDPVAHPKGSGNAVMAVGGLGSMRKRRADGSAGPSISVDWAVLGYARTDVSFFSYAAHSTTYEKADTYGSIRAKARLLGEQLQAAAREQPGRHFDLVGHSQGGVVIDLFIMEVYRGHEREYPPIDNVVTFASPHEGSPAAALGHTVGSGPSGTVATPLVRAAIDVPLDAHSMGEIASGSPVIDDLWSHGGPPPRVRYLSIMGSLDPEVPSNVGDVPDQQKIVVPVGRSLDPSDDHTAILHDSDAISAAQAHLSGGSPADSCGPLVDAFGMNVSAVEVVATSFVSGAPLLGSPLSPPDLTQLVEGVP